MKNAFNVIAICSRRCKFTGKGEIIGNQVVLCREHIRTHYGDEAAEKAAVSEDKELIEFLDVDYDEDADENFGSDTKRNLSEDSKSYFLIISQKRSDFYGKKKKGLFFRNTF